MNRKQKKELRQHQTTRQLMGIEQLTEHGMVGWNVPGADPQNYVCEEPQMGGMTLG